MDVKPLIVASAAVTTLPPEASTSSYGIHQAIAIVVIAVATALGDYLSGWIRKKSVERAKRKTMPPVHKE